MIALRATDGSSPTTFYSVVDPGRRLPDDADCTPAGGNFYKWKDVTPFGIETPSAFLLPGPPSVASHRYTKDYPEVMTVGAGQHRASGRSGRCREAVRCNVAEFCAEHGDRQIATAKRLSMSENARALALS